MYNKKKTKQKTRARVGVNLSSKVQLYRGFTARFSRRSLGTMITQIRCDYMVLNKEFFKVLLKAMKVILKYMYNTHSI